MPILLKTFELNGYKTFASRTEFQFADGITAIVGPNGSGKSNIADAIRWVLGEQSFGLLRGKKTEDMIFAGSEHRSRAGMAQATVVFDNFDGWLPIDFSEVAITRRAYRDGENEYFLNGQKVRLRDVSELLAKSGLAERTYTIIGQGLVDAALALKAEERRRLFEEAAGIGLYRSRREESLRRLDSTKRNLERVQDILSELKPRLNSLERQAKRAQEYDRIRLDLQKALKEWYGYHWHRAQADYSDAHKKAKTQEDELNAVQQSQQNVDIEISSLRNQLQNLYVELNEWRKKTTDLNRRLDSTGRGRVVRQERIQSLNNQISDSKIELKRQLGVLVLMNERVDLVSGEKDQITKEVNDCKQHLLEAEQMFQQKQKEQKTIDLIVSEARSALSELTSYQTELRARYDEIGALGIRQQNAIDELNKAIVKLKEEQQNKQIIEQNTKQSLEIANANLSKLESQMNDVQWKFGEAEKHLSQIRKEKDSLEGQISRIQSEIEILERAESELHGYADGSQLLIHSMGANSAVLGALGAHIEVPEAYEQAVATALGEYVEGVVYAVSDKVDESLDLLRDRTTRGAIFPLDTISIPRLIKIDFSKAPTGEESVVGIASELVQCPDEFRKVVELLLGQVIVVKDRAAARALIASAKWEALPGLRVVTLNGELFSVNGIIAVGASSRGIISRPRQLKELKQALFEREQKLVQVNSIEGRENNQHETLLNILSSAKSELATSIDTVNFCREQHSSEEILLEKINNNLNWRLEQKDTLEAEIERDQKIGLTILEDLRHVEERVGLARDRLQTEVQRLASIDTADAQDQLSYWKTRSAVSGQALSDSNRRYLERTADVERVQKEIEIINSRIGSLEIMLRDNISEKEDSAILELRLEEEIRACNTSIAPLEEKLNQLENAQNSLLVTDNEVRQRLRNAEHFHAQSKINLARQQEVLDTLRRRVEDDFGLVSFEYAETVSGPRPLPIDGMVENLPHITELTPDAEDALRRERNQLKRLGPINFEAQEEYNEVADRYKFLTDQVADLQIAEKGILEVIAELDMLMEREFRRTFDAVAQEFKTIFHRLFNGGIARLTLTDPESIADTGIDIEARLPGRREQGLSLLSGGERSLTAVALVFALLKIAPTPFCILDEVDAMLDEANVTRFREMLIELSEKTQFIVITHNRNTVQAAGAIYGVTMGRDSSSQVISLRLSEVSSEYGI